MSTVKQQDTPMPFGKYKGKLICDLPNSYIFWLLDQDWVVKDWPNLYEQIQIENQYRDKFGFDEDEH
jgi:uncharacterized protein (DUF3820 family)